MSQKAHRIFIDSVSRDSAEAVSKEEFTRYTFSVSGEGFSTDGKHVSLPYDVRDEVAMCVQAAIWHEVFGHGTYSDWAVVAGVGYAMPWIHGSLNTFEDMTVDKRVAERYPQAMLKGEHYACLLKYAAKKIDKGGGVKAVIKKLDAQDPKCEMRIQLELLWMAYTRLGCTEGMGDHHPLTDAKVMCFIDANRPLLERMIDAAQSKNATTKKNRSLAIKLWEMIHGKPAKPEPPKPEPPQNWELEDDEKPEPPKGGGDPPPPMPQCECGCH